VTGARQIRTVIVDDSAVARQLLHWVLTQAGDFEVIETVSDGERAVERISKLRPDLVTMDLHLPGIDGLEVTRRVMRRAPTPIAIVAASANLDDTAIFEALEAGALTAVQRPLAQGQPGYLRRRRRLLDELRAIAPARVARLPRPGVPATRATSEHASLDTARIQPAVEAGSLGPVDLIAVAASTGGPQALRVLLSGLARGRSSPDRGPSLAIPPILVVQHITEGFVSGMAGWLATAAAGPVRVAVNGERPEAGSALIAPDGRHLTVTPDGRVRLLSTAPVGGLRPSADVLFRSVAAAFGPRAVGVVLTGMGRDGADGLLELRQTGARTIAEDPATAIVGGMPGAAVELGGIDQVLSLDQIGPALARLLVRRSATPMRGRTARGPLA
jgi:two-component system chemotaxis response regulator CheB